MNPIKSKNKIRALEILEKIESFNLRENLLCLQKLIDEEKQNSKLLDSTMATLNEFEDYENTCSDKASLDDRHHLSEQYVNALLQRRTEQKALIAANQQSTMEQTKETEQSYNLSKNLGKKLKLEHYQYRQAVELYNAEV